MKDYWVTYEFHNKKSSATKNLAHIKKDFPNARLEEDGSKIVITIGHYNDYETAMKKVKELYHKGHWGGIYTPN